MNLSQKLRRETGRVARQAMASALRPVAVIARNRFLFILAHMRSGSSLLGHLLCSSREIVGYGETHNDYRRPSDLAKLLVSVGWNTGENPLRYRYILDKLVSMQDEIAAPVLRDERTRYVFLVREPRATVSSLVAMRRRECGEPDETLIPRVVDDYVTRLQKLVNLAETIADSRRSMLLTYRQLVAETSASFTMLEEFLGLRAPLREEYRVTPTTGQPGIGDPSPNIRIGRIDRSIARSQLELPQQVLDEIDRRFSTCMRQIRGQAQAIGVAPCELRAA